jgi:predicted dienelactone hydrolase
LANTYVESGPHPVGVTTLELEAGNKVEIWYPAVEGTTGKESYDVREFVPEAIRALLTADVPAVYEYEAGRDAAMADGTYPLVLFSHGYSGIRLQSTFLTAHLASWGMVVVSPDHWSRDLYHVLSAPVGDRQSSIGELLASLDLISAQNTTAGSIFEGRIDDSRVIAVGHSAGGGTVVGAAADDRIDGYVSLASGVGISSENTTTAPLNLPNKPSFFLAGALDGVISAQTSTKPSFEAVPAPSRLWIIDGVGHNGFDDFCTFGNGSGIIGVAMASGLGALLEAQPQLKSLGEDGCVPPALDVDLGFPLIKHAVTAQIRFWFGDDAEPIGIGPEVADQYELAVEIAVRD